MLYFVSTPIGNLEDISLRAISVLNQCDIIACEDTRHSRTLLENYQIKAKTIAYHKHNEQVSSDGIINLLKQNKKVAVISDAGMPAISDPGSILVNKLIENKLDYTIIPGANAALSALVLSGFDSNKFAFFGFLTENNKQRKLQLQEIKEFKGTRILYSSKHNVNKDLNNIYLSLGRVKMAIVSEITKMFERTQFVTLPYVMDTPKGEYVLLIEYDELVIPTPPDKELLVELNQLIATTNKTAAIKQLKEKYSLTKSYIYNLYEKNKTV